MGKHAFNSRLQPTQIALGVTPNVTDLLKLNYDYGSASNNGNVQSQTITVPTVGINVGFSAVQTYNYDSLNRLKDATENVTPTGGSASQSWKQTFTYDRYGNRRFDEGNTTMPNSFSNQAITDPTISTSTNRITSAGYSFDNGGNTTADASGRTFVYDAENKQTSVSDSNGTIGQYWYDGDGKRVKKYVPSTGETTIFVYDASGKSIAEYSTVVANSTDAKVNYLTADHLGSPRINTDQNGAVITRHDYMPFGEEIDGTGGRTTGLNYGDDTVRKQFTGYERDTETDLDFAQARYYAKNFGRFNSPDPLLSSGRIRVPQSWNRYSYVLGNPIKYSDPLGLYEYAEGTSEDDKKRIKKAYDKLVAARDKFKEGTKKYNEINKSITTLGKPGEANGVFIYVNNNQATPGKTDGAPTFGSDDKATGKAENWIGLNLTNSSNATSEGLAGTLGHEGRHAADNLSEAASLKGLSLLQYNERKDAGQIMSHAITEVNAYRVSSYIAEAISPSNVANVSVNGSEIWNRSWKAVDQDANRDKGIIGVLESPNGSYKFKFTPDPKSANNSIDNPALWTTNGGPIF